MSPGRSWKFRWELGLHRSLSPATDVAWIRGEEIASSVSLSSATSTRLLTVPFTSWIHQENSSQRTLGNEKFWDHSTCSTKLALKENKLRTSWLLLVCYSAAIPTTAHIQITYNDVFLFSRKQPSITEKQRCSGPVCTIVSFPHPRYTGNF